MKKQVCLPSWVFFVFIPYFIGAILSKKYSQKLEVSEKDIKGGWPYRGSGGEGRRGHICKYIYMYT